jgi:hypothetical protein
VNDVNTKTGVQTVRSRSYLASLPDWTSRAGAALEGRLNRGALRTIVEEGLLSLLRRTNTPYPSRAGSHFDPASSTYSERLLRRWADRRSPVERRKATPQTEASEEENAAPE